MPTERKWTRAELEAEAAAFDWSYVNGKADDEIEAAALADPDSYLASDEELQAAVRERAGRLKKRQPGAGSSREAAE